MKRLLTLALVVVLSFNLAACSKPSNTTTGKNPNWSNSDSSKTSSGSSGNSSGGSTARPDQDPTDVRVEDLEISWEIQVPDGSRHTYAVFTFKNNSPYPIVRLSIKALLTDTNETAYYTTHYTVLPGETSTIFDSFGPESGNPEDLQFLSVEYNVYVGDGKVIEYDYDYKLDNYTKWDFPYSYNSMDIVLNVSDYVLEADYHPSSYEWDRYLNMTYTNNSDYPITGFSLVAKDKSDNSITYLSCYDTVMPGETSPAFHAYSSAAQSMNDFEYLKLELDIFMNGSSSYYKYDYKLEIWVAE